jgi:hypothetical protein
MAGTAVAEIGTGTPPLAVVQPDTGRAVTVPQDPAMAFLQTIEQRVQLATMLVHSGLIPQRTPEQAMAVMLAGYELGIPPMAAFQNIHAIPQKGGGLRLTKSADLAVAIAQQRYGVKLHVVEWTNELCRLVFTRPGFSDVRVEFTMADARRAGLADKDNWKSWPKPMLASKAKLQGVRMICPEIGAGFYDADELGAVTDEHGAPVDKKVWEFTPSAEAGEGGAQAPAAGGGQTRSGGGAQPKCPKCGGPMWDNREQVKKKKAEGKRPGPEWKCKQKGGDPNCDGLFWEGQWPPKEEATQGEQQAAGTDPLLRLRENVLTVAREVETLQKSGNRFSPPGPVKATEDLIEMYRGKGDEEMKLRQAGATLVKQRTRLLNAEPPPPEERKPEPEEERDYDPLANPFDGDDDLPF